MAKPYKRTGRAGWTAPYTDPATGRRKQRQFPMRRDAEAFVALKEAERRGAVLGRPAMPILGLNNLPLLKNIDTVIPRSIDNEMEHECN